MIEDDRGRPHLQSFTTTTSSADLCYFCYFPPAPFHWVCGSLRITLAGICMFMAAMNSSNSPRLDSLQNIAKQTSLEAIRDHLIPLATNPRRAKSASATFSGKAVFLGNGRAPSFPWPTHQQSPANTSWKESSQHDHSATLICAESLQRSGWFWVSKSGNVTARALPRTALDPNDTLKSRVFLQLPCGLQAPTRSSRSCKCLLSYAVLWQFMKITKENKNSADIEQQNSSSGENGVIPELGISLPRDRRNHILLQTFRAGISC